MQSGTDPPESLHEVRGGLEFVREHRQMFQHIAYDGPSAIAAVAEAAVRSGAQRVRIGRLGRGFYLSADVDWLANSGDRDPFTEIVPFPEFGPNGIHPEVVVAAFSRSLVTISRRVARIVVGEQRFDTFDIEDALPDGRVVIIEF